MRHARGLVGLLAVGATAACTLVTSLDGLSEDGAPIVDGSPPEIGTTDGAVDPDVVRPGEAGADAGADGSWCEINAPDASFCEDFDRFGLTQFTSVEGSGATVQLVTTDVRSAPNALLATGSGPAEIHGSAIFERPGDTTDVTFSADIRVDKANLAGNQPAQVLVLFFGAAPGYQIGIGVVGTSRERYVFFYEPTTTAYDVLARGGTWLIGQWVRVTMHVHLTAVGSGTVDVDFDGTPLAKNLPIAPPVASSPVQLSVGIRFANSGHDGWTTRTDNVVLDAK